MKTMTPAARGASAYTYGHKDAGAASVADAWGQLIDELLRIRTLQDDWDGEGTVAPDPALIDGAIRLALELREGAVAGADRVIAGVNGSIYFEWHTPQEYVEIEVTSPLDAELRRVSKATNITATTVLIWQS